MFTCKMCKKDIFTDRDETMAWGDVEPAIEHLTPLVKDCIDQDHIAEVLRPGVEGYALDVCDDCYLEAATKTPLSAHVLLQLSAQLMAQHQQQLAPLIMGMPEAMRNQVVESYGAAWGPGMMMMLARHGHGDPFDALMGGIDHLMGKNRKRDDGEQGAA